jgi:predicted N-acetyltransferase YhbS/putative sterol carrier protein
MVRSGKSMEGKVFYRKFRESDEGVIKSLIESAFSDFLGGRYWSWKYKKNPYFDCSLVVVAEENGKIVGCNHWLIRIFKLSSSLEAKAVLAADITVKPEYQRKGIGKALIRSLRASETIKNKGVAVIYMFADPNLAKHFHAPVAGYIPAPDKTVSYIKILSWAKLKETVNFLNEKMKSGKIEKKLPRISLKITFRNSQAPTLYLRIDDKGVEVEEGDVASRRDADVTISGDLATFESIKVGKRRKWKILKALLTGKLKIKGKFAKLFGIRKALWVLEEIFGGKIT